MISVTSSSTTPFDWPRRSELKLDRSAFEPGSDAAVPSALSAAVPYAGSGRFFRDDSLLTR